MNHKEATRDIFDIIRDKEFQQLTPNEQKIYLAEFPREDYEMIRETIGESESFLAGELETIAFDSEQSFEQFKKQAQSADRSTNKKEPLLRALLLHPVPAYQVAAVLFIMIGGFFLLRSSEQGLNPKANSTFFADSLFHGTTMFADSNATHFVPQKQATPQQSIPIQVADSSLKSAKVWPEQPLKAHPTKIYEAAIAEQVAPEKIVAARDVTARLDQLQASYTRFAKA